LCLRAGLLTAAPDDGPRLARGQELLYRGRFREESLRRGVPHDLQCDVEIRWFVLDATARGFDLACCTLLRPAGAAPGSVRLELFRADPRGRLTPRGGPPPAPPPPRPPTPATPPPLPP